MNSPTPTENSEPLHLSNTPIMTPETPMQTTLPLPAPNRTANRLTLSQSYALGDWIMQHQQQCKDEADTQCADHAAIDLGFNVTPANFTAARQARGIEKTKPITPPTVEERLIAAEAQIDRLTLQAGSAVNTVNSVLYDIKTRLRRIEETVTPPPHRFTAGYQTITPSDIECPTPFEDISTATEPEQH